jgi:mannitol/fructose-specific phosphotransferase system IIA component (Ntr-type)
MLSTYLDASKIIIDLHAKTYREALQKMIERSSCQDHTLLLAGILDREQLMSTALGKGMAFPRVHVTDKEVSEILIGINRNGIDSRGFDLVPIYFLVLHIFSPKDDHASILAQSLHLFNDDTMRAELLQVTSGDEFIRCVKEWEEK